MKSITALALIALALAVTQRATAAPVYSIVALGLDDLEHTRSDGYQFSTTRRLNEAGQVSGESERYNGGSTLLGQSAWLYNGTTTLNIGLVGAEHTASDGFKDSDARQLNEAGQVVGVSNRFNGGSTPLGRSAWLYDGTTTFDIGLVGTEHTGNDGYKSSSTLLLNEAGQVLGESLRFTGAISFLNQSVWLYNGTTTLDIGPTGIEYTDSDDGSKFSRAQQLNEAGQAIGWSRRYSVGGTGGGGDPLGQSAWLYNGTTTLDIGLTGPEHTRGGDGFKVSSPWQLNEAGQVIGESDRFSGVGSDLGLSAWLYNGTTTLDIGLVGAEHTRNDGYKESRVLRINQAGQVIGDSLRYHGGNSDLGRSAWLYNGATTLDIGLVGAEHTRNDGYKSSSALGINSEGLNEAGQVAGTSARFNGGSSDLGRSTWLYNGTTTIDIGLTGPEHTRDDGYKLTIPWLMNEAGQVVGRSERYNGGSSVLGQSSWLYNGTATVNIGLTDAEHTRNDGYKFSEDSRQNQAGQVAGFSNRFDGGVTQLGQTAWLYDPTLDQTFPLLLSTRSDGYAFSRVLHLGEDGLALGDYTLFDAFDNDLGSRAFYFTIADGLHDLGSLVDGGLAANGWDWLAIAVRANGAGQILGLGKTSSQSGGQMAYLLTPIPEPAGGAIALVAAITLLARRPVARQRAQTAAPT